MVEQSDCPGCDLHHSGLHDVEIYQLPAASVERTSSESILKEEIFLIKGQIQKRYFPSIFIFSLFITLYLSCVFVYTN